MSKKFSRNFACQNDFRYVEKSQPLTRICVEKILSKFCLSKQFSYICKNSCRKYSGSHFMFEIFLSKLFSLRAQKCEIFYNVEIIPGIRTRLLNIFDCRKNSVFLIWSTRKFSNVENILHSKCWFTRWGIFSNLFWEEGICSKLMQNFFDTHFGCRNFSVEVYTVEKITPCTVENILSREKTHVEKILS